MFKVRLLIVGDPNVGKSSIISQYTKGIFQTDNHPKNMNEDVSTKIVQQSQHEFLINILSMASQDENQVPTTYSNLDAVIFVFSVVSRNSFNNVETKWVPEIKKTVVGRSIPFILIGNKVDLRDSKICACQDEPCFNEDHFIQEKEGKDMALRIGALAFIETSAVSGRGLGITFGYVVDSVLKRINKECHKCGCLPEDRRFLHECSKCLYLYCAGCFEKSDTSTICKSCKIERQRALIEEEKRRAALLLNSKTVPTPQQYKRFSMNNAVSYWTTGRSTTPTGVGASSKNVISNRAQTPFPGKSSPTTPIKTTSIGGKQTVPTKTANSRNSVDLTRSKKEVSPIRRHSRSFSLSEAKQTVRNLEDQIQALLKEKKRVSELGEEEKAVHLLQQVCKLQEELSELQAQNAVWSGR